MQRIRSHLTYANVVATLALVLVLAGGTAAAASYVVSSNSQIGPGTISGHKPPSGKHANIIANSINGKDIADRSGVDTCQTPLLGKFGPLCAGSDGGARNWQAATNYCQGFGLRLPTVGEAIALASNYDVPGVTPFGPSETGPFYFWTDSPQFPSAARDPDTAGAVTEAGELHSVTADIELGTVCVTDPSA